MFDSFLLYCFIQYGGYDPDVHKPGFLAKEELLPKRVSDGCFIYWHLYASALIYLFYGLTLCMYGTGLPAAIYAFTSLSFFITGNSFVPDDSRNVGGEDHCMLR